MTELDARSILQALDEDQQQPVAALSGPVAIIAGPGSGKTRTISHRIAYGVATGVVNPQRVLALTYTNRAAAELRLRLRQLGVSVQVRTFHSAALGQLQYFWPQITGYSAPKLVTAKQSLVQEAAESIRLRLGKTELTQLISEIEYLSYAQLAAEEVPSQFEQQKFVDVVNAYRQLKADRKVIDWEDTLLLCTGMLRNEPRVMAQFEQQYRNFTVDEYQDISPLQQGLLDTWLAGRSEICVVGDPRQTIYSFTGATSEFLMDFSTRYPDAEVFQLNRNYRSGQDIVSIANRVLPELPLEPVHSERGQVRILTFPTAEDESSEIAKEISQSSHAPAEIAVLARTNSQLALFEQELSRQGIRYQVRGQGRFFTKPEIRSAMMAIRALNVVAIEKDLLGEITEILRSLGWSAAPGETSQDLNWFLEVFEELSNPGLEEYLRELDERERSGHEPSQNAVTLATVHGTKGLEWAQVHVVGMNEKLFPISHAQSDGELAEERRLFYVAVTRAKQTLTLSSVGNRPLSRFITELTDNRN